MLSNLPFVVVGLLGLARVARNRSRAGETAAGHAVFFLGVLLTGFGSGYYHLAPANETLVWDRLAMTISFAGLFSVVVGEFVSARLGRQLLVPLLVAGMGSVVYWAFTEARGAGDLRPYALAQFLPMLLTPVILVAYGKGRPASRYFWFVIFFYVLAKVAEFYDAEIFAGFRAVSGHSLKHLLAALAPVALLYALAARNDSITGRPASGRTPH